VRILDAVIRHADHSGGTIHSWIGGRTQPLKRLLTERNGHHAALSAFLLERGNQGITFDFEGVLSDLVEIWSTARGSRLDREQTRGLVSRYFPVALEIGPQEPMMVVFDKARTFVADSHLTSG
jgi:hypothetical protein